jgi:hypothetical protein
MNAKLKLAGIIGAVALAVPSAGLIGSAVAASDDGSTATTQQDAPETFIPAQSQEQQPDQPRDRDGDGRLCPEEEGDGGGGGDSGSGSGSSADTAAPTEL